MNKFIKLLLSAILCCFWGCTEKEEPVLFEAPIQNFTSDSEGGELTFTFTVNTAWKTEIGAENPWVSVFPTNGQKGTHTLSIKVKPNESLEQRYGKISILIKDTYQMISIVQKSNVETLQKEERKILEKFYHTTNGSEWVNNTNWLSEQPIDQWVGIQCNEYGFVRGISLEGNNLQGTIPAELEGLKHLEYLFLPNNQLGNGTLETISKLTNLKELFLYNNPLSGGIPSAIGNLSKLEVLDLGNCQLKGEIPETITQLSNLEDLFLELNSLTGGIPSAIGNLSKLKRLDLDDCPLAGEIPGSIGLLSNLSELELFGCGLTGRIPQEICQLSNLEFLNLGYNNLSGNIPDSIGNLTNLVWLNLCNNKLSGNIPEGIVNLKKMYFVDLGYNYLSGLPLNISELPCWQYMWYEMIKSNFIEYPIVEGLIPGPYFKIKDLEGNVIESAEEYKKNAYTILVQYDFGTTLLEEFLPVLISLYHKYADKNVDVIGWSYNAVSKYDFNSIVKELNIPWRNFYADWDNVISSHSITYPFDYRGFGVHVVDSNNKIVFSSLATDINTLPEFMKEIIPE